MASVEQAKQSKRTCAFCGSAGPLTLEHVFSRAFMQKLFHDRGVERLPQGMERLTPEGKFERVEYERRALKGVGPELRTICATCNGGWMRLMDEDIQPVLFPLCYAVEGELAHPEGNRDLARWAIKISLTLTSDWNWPRLQKLRSRFYTEQEPLDGTYVWLGCRHWSPSPFRYLSGALGPPDDPSFYSVTFHVLHMVVQVFIAADAGALSSRDEGSWYLQRVWPLPETPVEFPQSEWMWIPDDEMFDFVANRLRDLQRRPRGNERGVLSGLDVPG